MTKQNNIQNIWKEIEKERETNNIEIGGRKMPKEFFNPKRINNIEPEKITRTSARRDGLATASGSTKEFVLADKRRKDGLFKGKDVKQCFKEIKEIVEDCCRGTSANCWEIKKKIDKKVGDL